MCKLCAVQEMRKTRKVKGAIRKACNEMCNAQGGQRARRTYNARACVHLYVP